MRIDFQSVEELNRQLPTMNGMIEDRTWDGNEVLETLATNGARILRMAIGRRIF